MRRAGSRLIYFARTALRGLAGSPVTSVVAVATIGVSLVLVGAFALLLQNMEELLERFGDDLHVRADANPRVRRRVGVALLDLLRDGREADHLVDATLLAAAVDFEVAQKQRPFAPGFEEEEGVPRQEMRQVVEVGVGLRVREEEPSGRCH